MTAGQPDAADPRAAAHRYAAPFLAACGARPPMRTAPDEGKVTCEDCKALPPDPGAFAAHDQLRAMLATALSSRGQS